MNFYPIYKSKLEPWIKWWILKGNKILPKVLSEVIEGTTPITIEGVYKGTSLQDLLFKGQTIQEGTPSPEAPIPVQVVKEDNTITINEDSFIVNLGEYELCKIGNYQDSIYYENNKWYIEKNINKVTFNGTETWTRTTRTDGNVFWNYYDILNVPKPLLNSNIIKICNYFPYEFKSWGDVSVNCLGENGLFNVDRPSFLFRISTDILTTVEEWNTWLSNNNTTVYYVLATPTTSEITDINLISQLEAIKNASLISGTNEITQTPSDLPFILNFKYYMKG